MLILVGLRENWDIFVGRCFLNKLMVVTLYCQSLYCFVEIFFAPLPQPIQIICIDFGTPLMTTANALTS